MVRFQIRPALQVSLSLVQASRDSDFNAASVLIDAWRMLLVSLFNGTIPSTLIPKQSGQTNHIAQVSNAIGLILDGHCRYR